MATTKSTRMDREGPDRTRWLMRLVVVLGGLGLWFLTQSLLGSRPLSPADDVGGQTLSQNDGLFRLTEPLNQYFQSHPQSADALLIASSAVIDVLGIGLIVASIFGPTMRPFLGLLMLFALRQLMQALCVLPTPEGMIWRDPGWRSLLVTYQVANDFFFSGHTAIAVFGATQLARFNRSWLTVLGVAIAFFEVTTVIVLRAHYTMDVFTGALAALWAASVADKIAPAWDRMVAHACERRAA
jgi:membrane-associated phospholipid phosphatase